MMDLAADAGRHDGYIWAAYAAVGIIIGVLIAWMIYDGRRQASALAAADRRGLKRRSDSSDAARRAP